MKTEEHGRQVRDYVAEKVRENLSKSNFPSFAQKRQPGIKEAVKRINKAEYHIPAQQLSLDLD